MRLWVCEKQYNEIWKGNDVTMVCAYNKDTAVVRELSTLHRPRWRELPHFSAWRATEA